MEDRPEEPPLPSSPRGGASPPSSRRGEAPLQGEQAGASLLRGGWVGPGIKMCPCLELGLEFFYSSS